MKVTAKPDISAFLAKYPMQGNHGDHEGGRDRDGGSSGSNTKDEDADEECEYPKDKVGSAALTISAATIKMHDWGALEDEEESQVASSFPAYTVAWAPAGAASSQADSESHVEQQPPEVAAERVSVR